ncbi:glycosyltransferase [Dietzia cinnamea]|uniref:glycosyltransferase n=1 Tax=Dietzia cinnamea TaxID=321318 RepID=UPI0021A43A30|nr:glycosyltransferase [Dietzia cinnamea]MCT2140668.1 glycosyltransferase [Dietzia cinnamea]
MTKVALFTSAYPYGSGESFVEAEVSIASKLGYEIDIWPLKAIGTARALPPNVRVNLDLADRWAAPTFVRGAIRLPIDREFWSEFVKLTSEGRLKASISALVVKSIQRLSIGRVFADLEPKLRGYDVLYSYWASFIPIGFASLGESWSGGLRVSRGHGTDIYAYANPGSFVPYRAASWKRLDRLYLVSEHGLNYVKSHYDFPEERLHVSRLGALVGDTLVARGEESSTVRILTIGNAVAVKRLDLAIEACAELAQLVEPRSVIWTHVGSGELELAVSRLGSSTASRVENFGFEMLGQLSHTEVLRLLRDTPISLLLSVSASEGIPVSQMEAMERGIPVVSTLVGGVEELIKDTDSIGVSADASPREIALAMKSVLEGGASGVLGRQKILAQYDLFKNVQKFYADLDCSSVRVTRPTAD